MYRNHCMQLRLKNFSSSWTHKMGIMNNVVEFVANVVNQHKGNVEKHPELKGWSEFIVEKSKLDNNHSSTTSAFLGSGCG